MNLEFVLDIGWMNLECNRQTIIAENHSNSPIYHSKLFLPWRTIRMLKKYPFSWMLDCSLYIYVHCNCLNLIEARRQYWDCNTFVLFSDISTFAQWLLGPAVCRASSMTSITSNKVTFIFAQFCMGRLQFSELEGQMKYLLTKSKR